MRAKDAPQFWWPQTNEKGERESILLSLVFKVNSTENLLKNNNQIVKQSCIHVKCKQIRCKLKIQNVSKYSPRVTRIFSCIDLSIFFIDRLKRSQSKMENKQLSRTKSAFCIQINLTTNKAVYRTPVARWTLTGRRNCESM